MPSAFLCLRRFYAFGVSMFHVSMPSAFFATLFNFVEGFAVQWLRRFCGYAVSMPTAFLWLRRLNAFGV